MVNVQRLWLLQQLSSLRTISAVAVAENMTRPGDSQHLTQLEREVGVILLERVGRGVRLTGAARMLLERSQRLFEELETIELHIDMQRGGIEGEVRIGCFSSALSTLVPQALQLLGRSHPGVSVRLFEFQPRAAITALTGNQIDVAVVHDFLFENTDRRIVDPIPFFTDRFFLVVSDAHPLARAEEVALAELSGERWALNVSVDSYIDRVLGECRAAGFDPNLVGECNQISTVYSLVQAEIAVTMVPGLALTAMPPGLSAIKLSTPVLRHTHLAYRRGRGGRPATDATLSALRLAAEHWRRNNATVDSD